MGSSSGKLSLNPHKQTGVTVVAANTDQANTETPHVNGGTNHQDVPLIDAPTTEPGKQQQVEEAPASKHGQNGSAVAVNGEAAAHASEEQTVAEGAGPKKRKNPVGWVKRRMSKNLSVLIKKKSSTTGAAESTKTTESKKEDSGDSGEAQPTGVTTVEQQQDEQQSAKEQPKATGEDATSKDDPKIESTAETIVQETLAESASVVADESKAVNESPASPCEDQKKEQEEQKPSEEQQPESCPEPKVEDKTIDDKVAQEQAAPEPQVCDEQPPVQEPVNTDQPGQETQSEVVDTNNTNSADTETTTTHEEQKSTEKSNDECPAATTTDDSSQQHQSEPVGQQGQE